MHQRPCIAFPRPPAAGQKNNLALYMVRYMLQSGNSEIPIMFLNKEDIDLSVRKAYAGNSSSTDEVTEVEIELDQVDPISAMATLTVMALSKPMGCILTFDNGNSLCVVGSGSSFYMIDLSNGIFCHTTGPEYDINTYVDEHGSEDCKLQYFTLKVEEKPASPKPKRVKVEEADEEEAAPTTVVKKKKRATKATTENKKQ